MTDSLEDIRQASVEFAQPLLDIGPEEAFECVQRLRDDLGHLRERWDNRLILEDSSLWESYFDGRAEIVLYGNWLVGADHINCAVRIPAHLTVFHSIGANPGVDICDCCDGDDRQEIVVFVVIAEACGGPEVEVRIPARLYVFKDKFCGVGEGLLYQRIMGGGFKVFPFFRKREMEFFREGDDPGNCIHPVVERLPKIIHGVSDDWGKMICDWLFGPVGQVKTIRLSQRRYRASGSIGNFIQVLGQGGRVADNSINVAIGPFNL